MILLHRKSVVWDGVRTFLTFIVFFGGMLSVFACVRGHATFYPISLAASGDFRPVTGVVLLVTFRVIVFTFWYFNFEFFYWVLVLFVGAMAVLLSSSSWTLLLLGWDLLGIASYLLVLIYYNKVGKDRAINVFLVNRLGDCFILVLLVRCFLFSSSLRLFRV